MKKIDKDLVLSLSKDLMFELNETETTEILKEGAVFETMLAFLNKIDVSDVEAMHYPFETPLNYLREDTIDHQISQDVAFKNAPKTQGDYFEVVKVVK